MKIELQKTIESGVIGNLEHEIQKQRELVEAAAKSGAKGYIREVWVDLELDENGNCQLAKLLQKHLDGKNLETYMAEFDEIERAKVAMVKHQKDQLEEDYKNFTVAQAKPTATPKQIKIWEGECQKIELRLAALDKHLLPYAERQAQMEAEFQTLLDRYDQAVLTLKRGENRAKGAALTQVFRKILLYFGQVNEGHKGRGRRGRMISVWLPHCTKYVYHYDGLVPDDSAIFTAEQAMLKVTTEQLNLDHKAGQTNRISQKDEQSNLDHEASR